MGKKAMIELDKRCQKCREALPQLHKEAKNTTNKCYKPFWEMSLSYPDRIICHDAIYYGKNIDQQHLLFLLQKRKNWICFGNTTFLKVVTDQAKQMIEDDMKIIEMTLEAIREEIKNQVNKLKEMENCKSLEKLGFNLDPIA